MLTTLLLLSLFAADASAVFDSNFSAADWNLTADVRQPQWRSAPSVMLGSDYLGKSIEGPPTEVRSRWTATHLYLLYICPFTELNLKPNPVMDADTPQLWNWDVGEVFIGTEAGPTTRYKELQVSPQGEWVDLDIDRTNPKGVGMKWNSGYVVKARIDKEKKIWYGEMKIPFAALDTQEPAKGRTFRVGVYRIAGVEPNRQFYSWRTTGSKSFHVPESFGTLRLK